MTSNSRSIGGAVLMLAIIPIFAGLLACMPVPVGDPERSRIDPDFSGVWIWTDGDEEALYLFQPYDRRTWLLTGAEFVQGDEYAGEDIDIETPQDAVKALETLPIGNKGITSTETVIYKAWLTKLGGEQFMTWESMGGFNDDGSHTPEYWFVFKVEKHGADRFDLFMLNAEHDVFDDIPMPKEYEGDDYVKDMRKTWEKAIKRNADNSELYSEEALEFHRLPDSVMGQASELFQEVIEFEGTLFE